jgi:hypothetical protein
VAQAGSRLQACSRRHNLKPPYNENNELIWSWIAARMASVTQFYRFVYLMTTYQLLEFHCCIWWWDQQTGWLACRCGFEW